MRTVYDALDEHALNEQVDIQISDCQDRCDDAPNLTLLPGAFPYARLTPDGVRRIIKQHIAQNQPVVELLASLKQHRKGKKRKR
jgi:(2Fe-2S) ferredoxin